MSNIRKSLAAALLALCAFALPAHAQVQPDLISGLRAGGYVIVVRHGATNNDQADTDPFHLRNIGKQRQLTDEGRATAQEMGEAFRKLKIPVEDVITSPYFRAIETGQLAFGKAIPTVDVGEGGMIVTPRENSRRTAALRKLAGTPPAPGANTVIVSHKPNILDAFGKDWYDIHEGESSIFKPDGNGGYQFIARVEADDWKKLADTMN